MKRSEMVQIMIDADRNQSSCRSLYHTFSHILEKMEDSGMLPPPTTIYNTDDDNNPIWEPEDE